MSMKLIVSTLLTLLAFKSASASITENATVTTASYATVRDEVRVEYSIINFRMPAIPDDKILSDVVLELYMDVASTLGDTLSGGVATVEISVMPPLVDGKLPVMSAIAASRVAKVGDNRPVRIYITSVVQEAITQRKSDLTLLVGSITGARRGRFATKTVPGTGNARATVTVHFRNKVNLQALGME